MLDLREIKRGNVFYANLNPVVGSEQGGIRPVVIIQNDIGNAKSSTVLVATITTSAYGRKRFPTHSYIRKCSATGLKDNSVVLLEQIRTLDRTRLSGFIGTMCRADMKNVDIAIKISLGLSN